MKKIILINLTVLICLLISLEIIARIYISSTRGSSTAGLVERSLNLKYQPFVMYGPNWNEVYNDFNLELNKNKNNEDFVVLVIGGSTAQGFPNEILEKKISNKLNKKIKVFNSAYGGYISTQELIITTLYSKRINPDIIINLNTANDIIHSLRKNNKSGTFFLNNTYQNILSKPLLAPFIHLLQHSQLFNGLLRLKERNENFDSENYSKHVDLFVQNINNIYLYCQGANIKYLNVMQPHVIFKNLQHENEKNFKAYNYRSSIIKKLYNQIKEKISLKEENFLDARFIFQDNTDYIFSDDVHFIDNKGYELLADAISNKIYILTNK